MANSNERDTSFSKGGKVVYTATAKRPADGKTMTVAVKGTNPSGQTVYGTNFYDKRNDRLDSHMDAGRLPWPAIPRNRPTEALSRRGGRFLTKERTTPDLSISLP
jgi:hypothetical protein